jgi:hypothetical protein
MTFILDAAPQARARRPRTSAPHEVSWWRVRARRRRVGAVDKRVAFAASCLLVAAGAVSAGGGGVSITFVHPERYFDAAYARAVAGELERAEVQHDIEQHLLQLAERGLRPGESLRIEVLEIDLAGQFEPFRFAPGSDLRVFRDVSWPRLRLRYTITHGDGAGESREEQLADMNYLASFNRYAKSDRLRYEKAMLDAWFDKRIAGH